ncbi:MAG: peptidoglycan-binding protein [Phycisphaeraceae bacterium]|nr:peptidoglycan-binding protein [Phycisphaeraceae bacterium]
MGEQIVRQGEHVPGLAREAGLAGPESVWDHPENKALKDLRKDPCILAPGDSVMVPDKILGEVSRAVDARHRFRLHLPVLTLGLEFQRWDAQPIDAGKATATVDGATAALETEKPNRVRATIAPAASAATIRLGQKEIQVGIGRLDPIDTDSGLRERLVNLGYLTGDPALDEIRLGVEEFQLENGLSVDGIVGPKTRSKLEQVHGC